MAKDFTKDVDDGTSAYVSGTAVQTFIIASEKTANQDSDCPCYCRRSEQFV